MTFFDTARRSLKSFASKLRSVPVLIEEERRAVEAHALYNAIPADHANRKTRRAEGKKLRLRDRRTGISLREPARFPWAIHQDANNKAVQFINHGLLHSLFSRANVWSNPAP